MRRRCTVSTLRASFALLFVLSLVLTWCSLYAGSSMPRAVSTLRTKPPPTYAPAHQRRRPAHGSTRQSLLQRLPMMCTPTLACHLTCSWGASLATHCRLGTVRSYRGEAHYACIRHHPNRTLANIRFILEHEDLDDARVQTHWVLNRILDPVVQADIIALLTLFEAKYV